MTTLAEISSGAIAGSTQVTVTRNAANGTVILVHRGSLQLGSGTLTAGTATVTLSAPLAVGDIIQASVTTKGSQCGNPVLVVPSSVKVTGWKSPTEVYVHLEDYQQIAMPVDEFVQTYKWTPADLYDAIGTRSVLQPEYTPVSQASIQFDLIVERQAGQTVLTVANVQNTRGSALIRWNGGSWGNTVSQTYATGQTVTVDVRGADDPLSTFATRSFTVTILSSTPANGSLRALSYKFDSVTRGVNAICHSASQLQFRLNSGTWFDATLYPPTQNEYVFVPVPAGSHTLEARIKNDTTPANWLSLTFTLP